MGSAELFQCQTQKVPSFSQSAYNMDIHGRAFQSTYVEKEILQTEWHVTMRIFVRNS